MKNIREKIKDKSVVVGIFGLGYVGLPLAFVFAKKGIKVIGFDIIQERVDALNEGHTYIKSLMTKEALKDFKSKKTFLATTDFAKYTPQIDAAIICVPTPLDKYHQPDLSYLISTLDPLSKYLKKGSAVSLESTTYPGTTEEVMNVKMKEAGFEIGKDLFMI
jgi:UDP-N-acetyl-D-glucosamine dehydrogenase